MFGSLLPKPVIRSECCYPADILLQIDPVFREVSFFEGFPVRAGEFRAFTAMDQFPFKDAISYPAVHFDVLFWTGFSEWHPLHRPDLKQGASEHSHRTSRQGLGRLQGHDHSFIPHPEEFDGLWQVINSLTSWIGNVIEFYRSLSLTIHRVISN